MAKRLFALVITVLVTLFAFSLCNAAVTFRTNDPDGAPPPYPTGTTFHGGIWVESDEPVSATGFALYMEFDNVRAELANTSAPFTIGADFASWTVFDNSVVDSNKIFLSVINFMGSVDLSGGPYMIASVEFTKLTDTRVYFRFLEDEADYKTRYLIGGDDFVPDILIDEPDLSLPVEMSTFTAAVVNGSVVIKWSTESEINNLGFDLYRSESPDAQFVKINPAYIKGSGTDATPHDYRFVDESAVVGKTYYYYLETISFSGERDRSHIIKVIIDASGKMKVTGLMHPTAFALLQNFPNPFNPETWIPFHLADTADVTIRIFDIKGQELRTIHLGQVPAGYYDTRGKAALWDGRDSYGQEVSSGIYFYHLTAGDFHATRKLTIIK